MKPRDFIHVLENNDAPSIKVRDEQSELLLTMVAKLFFADRDLHEGEVRLVTRLAAEVADVPGYIEELAKRDLDYARLAAAFPDAQDRDDIITLGEHAVWGDDKVDSREWGIVDQFVEALGVERD